MEQLEFDCRLESERELEENVNIALEFAASRSRKPASRRYRTATTDTVSLQNSTQA